MKSTLAFVRAHKAFTLIELMIVIVIIGILAVALLPRVIGAPAKARDVTRKADISNLINAFELYAADVGYYPGTAGTRYCLATTDTTTIVPLIDDYLQELPVDPTGLDTNSTTCSDSYYYGPLTQSGSGDAETNYFLMANLEGAVTGAADDVFCTSSETTYFTFTGWTSYTAVETYLDGMPCGSASSNAYYVVLK
jgi:general secretion pathway protein G